ncbi:MULTISPECIES: hypothetical protein [unclassified Vibrio]|uniref:Antibiotic biosynthesis monooxygenase n=1 Tax=Vibrio sp. HB236076 TaxID=3232307 RepID=A0AB39HB11_9VIBR|nr:hypothetical protein [Vibrio sp. HB161653]MDP5255235.1 hypothetical protein [Vibrio sp. HB161653]
MPKVIIKGYMHVAERDVDVVTAAIDYHCAKALQHSGCLLFEIYPSKQERQMFHFHYEFVDQDAYLHYQNKLRGSAWHAITQSAKVFLEDAPLQQ